MQVPQVRRNEATASATEMSEKQKSSAIALCEEHVKRAFQGNDCSHDISHVYRVRSLALHLAQSYAQLDGGTLPDLFVVEMAALLHDLYDYKYSDLSQADARTNLLNFLLDWHVPKDVADSVVQVTQLVGYTKDQQRRSVQGDANGDANINARIWHEYACVQDADYLDAMGAIGMLRTSAFSGAKGRPLLDDSITSGNEGGGGRGGQSCIAHVYEKLLRLKELMRTEKGKTLAESRHQFMLSFLQQVHSECADSVF